jgi:hypothetical protein
MIGAIFLGMVIISLIEHVFENFSEILTMILLIISMVVALVLFYFYKKIFLDRLFFLIVYKVV